MAENKPKVEIRSGKVRASIWENKVKKDDEEVIRKSVTIEKSYKVDDGWKSQKISFFPDELPNLISVAQQAFDAACTTITTP